MKSIPALPWLKAGLVALAVSTLSTPTLAQNITAAGDGTGTNVNFDAASQTYTINGGTQIDANLFHSFQQFGLSTGEIANFLANPNVANILARVTGGDTSVINGLLQVSGGSNANLFILNPAGVLLGRDSSLNLAGSFSVSTASGLSFDNGIFSAAGSNDYSALTGNPNGYAFLGNEGIVLNEADLSVNHGESITLAGSTVINTGTLEAPEGNVSIVAVPEEGLLRISQEGLVLSLAVPTAQLDDLVETGITPLDLPSLLAGDWGGEATTVSTLPDGTVVLGGSEAPVNSDAGAITSTGTIDVSGAEGGDIVLIGNDIALPEGLIDISGTTAGGYLGVYARDDLSFGLTVDAAGGGYALFDPVTLNIGAAEAATIVGIVQGGGTSDQQASETINVNAPITVTSGTGGTLTFTDEDSNNDLTLNLNALISLSAGHTLTGEGTTVNVNTTDSGIVQNALDVAATGANVNLGAGTYREGQQLTLTRDVTLNGAVGNTTLDGNNSHRVLSVNSGVTVTLNDLTVSGGQVAGNDSGFVSGSSSGGGINNSGTLTLNDSIVSGNGARGGSGTRNFVGGGGSGGGINNSGTLTLNSSTISGNSTRGGDANGRAGSGIGGGIQNSGTLTLNNSTVSGNTASGGNVRNGGDGRVNGGSGSGGGIQNSGTLTLNNSTVAGNTASGGRALNLSARNGRGGGGNGGGIQNNGTLTLNNSTISGNTASGGNGSNRSGSSGRSGRGGSGQGGGINNASTLALNNSTVSGNDVSAGSGRIGGNGQGGGIRNSGTLALNNSTVSGNDASGNSGRGGGAGTGSGGGIHTSGNRSDAILRNSIIAGNTVSDTEPEISASGPVTSNNNLFGINGIAGFNFTPDATDITNPNNLAGTLANLADNGGLTQTHALVAGSAAIDAAGVGALATDQRNRAANSIRDIGAFEANGTMPLLAVNNGNGQSASLNTAFANNLVVRVEDNSGRALAGAWVTLAVPTIGASGVFNNGGTTITVQADASGLVTVPITANGTAGTFQVTASLFGNNPVTFDLLNTVPVVSEGNSDGLNADTFFNRHNPLDVDEGLRGPILVIDPALAEQLGFGDLLNEDGTLAPRRPQDDPAEHTSLEDDSTVNEDGVETLPLCTVDPNASGCFAE